MRKEKNKIENKREARQKKKNYVDIKRKQLL